MLKSTIGLLSSLEIFLAKSLRLPITKSSKVYFKSIDITLFNTSFVKLLYPTLATKTITHNIQSSFKEYKAIENTNFILLSL